MQFLFKLGLSAAVALAAIGSWLYMNQLGLSGPRWAVTFLGPFTILSLWLFSDVMRNRADGRTPRRHGEGARS